MGLMRYNEFMNPLAQLEQLALDPSTKSEVSAVVQALLDQNERDAKLIQAKDIKIQALTHELAYYRRIHFTRKSERLSDWLHILS